MSCYAFFPMTIIDALLILRFVIKLLYFVGFKGFDIDWGHLVRVYGALISSYDSRS